MKAMTIRHILCATTLVFAAGASYGVDTPSAPSDRLAQARALIAEKKWTAAREELTRVNDPGSADWNNLMGFSMRKGETWDLEASERFYDQALRIDPKHKGALEYSGELYLMKGDLPKAEERLARLDKACFLPCGEFKELKSAVEQYKVNGNKYVAR